MKRFLSLISGVLISATSLAQQNELLPQVFFDKTLAQNQLKPGKSTIEGEAFTREKANIPFTLGMAKAKIGKKHIADEGTLVMLFPVTDYFMEFYNLRKKKENRKNKVVMSPDAFETRREAYTDAYGRFKFDNLKIGKYYLETIIDFTQTGRYQQQVGNTNYYNAYGGYLYSNPIYQTYFYNYGVSHRESKFVEITKDGQIIEIKL